MMRDSVWLFLTRIVVFGVILSWVLLPSAMILFYEDLDDIEGSVMPVVVGTEITEAEPAESGDKTKIRMEFVKIRSCDPNAVIVFKRVGANNDIVIVPSRFLDDRPGVRLKSRQIGRNKTGWWLLDEPYINTWKTDYTIEVLHRCHPLYLTRTTMYVGPLSDPPGSPRLRHDFP